MWRMFGCKSECRSSTVFPKIRGAVILSECDGMGVRSLRNKPQFGVKRNVKIKTKLYFIYLFLFSKNQVFDCFFSKLNLMFVSPISDRPNDITSGTCRVRRHSCNV